MSTGFRFKQFFVEHDRSSMKVGTDGVLIGAWTPIVESRKTKVESRIRILDVGTGSGLIAMMLAQRCADAEIDAIDIDEGSCGQAGENFEASPWAERLHVTRSSLQEWTNGRKYDLIVSNPPYFVDSLKAPDAARCAARHNDTLPFSTLIAESTRLLKNEGTLALIVPCEAEEELMRWAKAAGLHLTRRCYVHPKPGRDAKRVMIAWEKGNILSTEPAERTERIVLEDEHGSRSVEYQQLTKDFYL